ncbi:MAG: hypothetical protein HQL76_15305 [Magnetococcales bacterium]|nr:hypothetical protein [Magnetococcales bacterium]
MLQLIPYGVAALVGGLLGKKYFPILADQTRKRKGVLATSPSMEHIELLGESMLQEESIILATEEVPLDNRFGNQILTSEHEFTKSATVALTIGQDQTNGGQVEAVFLPIMKTLIRGELKKSLRVDFDTMITRRVKINFSTQPGQWVRYRLTWRQTSRRGLFNLKIGGEIHNIPYLVTFGLSHAVESLEEGKNAGA